MHTEKAENRVFNRGSRRAKACCVAIAASFILASGGHAEANSTRFGNTAIRRGASHVITRSGVHTSTVASSSAMAAPTAGLQSAWLTLYQPWAIASGPDGAVWFSHNAFAIGRISTTGVMTNFAD